MCQTKLNPPYSGASRLVPRQNTDGTKYTAGLNPWTFLHGNLDHNGIFQPNSNQDKTPTEGLEDPPNLHFEDYGSSVNEESDPSLIFFDNPIEHINSEDNSVDQGYDTSDYISPQDECSEMMIRSQKRSTPETVESIKVHEKPKDTSAFHGVYDSPKEQSFPNQILGKRAHAKEGQDTGIENNIQLLRDADAEEFIEFLYDSLEDSSSSEYGASSSAGSLGSFSENTILSNDDSSSLQSAPHFSQNTEPCDREQNLETTSPVHHLQEVVSAKRESVSKILKPNSEPSRKSDKAPRLGLADASRRFATFCKSRRCFSSITEVASEILIDRKRLYDIANIFQELDIISKENDAFHFHCNGKILPLNQLQLRISEFERKGSLTSLPCTALLIIRHYVMDGNNGYTADELVDAVYYFYSEHPKYDSQKKNTIKRRVYDSLNILQGVGMIMKRAVNHGFFRFYLDLQRT